VSCHRGPPNDDDVVAFRDELRSAAKLRSGTLANAVIERLHIRTTAAWRCTSTAKRMSAVQSSSTIAGFQVLPQNSVNHRPTMAFFVLFF